MNSLGTLAAKQSSQQSKDLLALEDMQIQVINNLITIDSMMSRAVYDSQSDSMVASEINFTQLVADAKDLKILFESTGEVMNVARPA